MYIPIYTSHSHMLTFLYIYTYPYSYLPLCIYLYSIPTHLYTPYLYLYIPYTPYIPIGLLGEEEYDFEPTEEELILKRANEIMSGVWGELEGRMVTRSTGKAEFFAANLEQAKTLAFQEFKVEKTKKLSKIMELRSTEQFLDKYVDATRRQYAKLLNMERRELQNQKEISDTWVKYIYLLLEGMLLYSIVLI